MTPLEGPERQVQVTPQLEASLLMTLEVSFMIVLFILIQATGVLNPGKCFHPNVTFVEAIR